jgi:hypothetical protein
MNNIKMDLRLDVVWTGSMSQDKDQWRAVMNTAMNLRVPYNVGKLFNSCTIGSFSRKAQLHEVS